MNILLPIRAVKRRDFERIDRYGIKAIDIYADARWV